MKLRTLVKKAKDEIKEENGRQAIKLVKLSLKAIKDCKKTLKNLEKKHNELLDMDLDDLETDEFEY